MTTDGMRQETDTAELAPQVVGQADHLGADALRVNRGYSPKELRHALWLIFIAWGFGAAFFAITTGAAFTAFLTKFLHTDDLSYGLIMAAGPAAVLFQFLGSYLVERTGRIKRVFLIFVTLHRLIWLLIAAVPLLMPTIPHAAAMGTVGLLVFLSAALANYGGAGWADWMSRIVPTPLAGKYFGARARLGLASMLVVSTAGIVLLQQLQEQGWLYALIFGIAAVFGAMDILLFSPVREIPRKVEETLPTMFELLCTPWRNSPFRWYALYTAVTWIAYTMMSAFIWRLCYTPLAEHGLGMSVLKGHVLLYVLPLLPMVLTAPFWGQAIDRFGPKPVLGFSSLTAIILPLPWLVMRPEIMWTLPLVTPLIGFTWPGVDQVVAYMQIKGFPATRRTAFNAMFLTVFGLAGMMGTSLGGVLASFFEEHLHLIPYLPEWTTQYHLVFLISILLRVFALLFLFPRLPIPGDSDAGHHTVVRSVASELLASLPRGRQRRRKNSDRVSSSR